MLEEMATLRARELTLAEHEIEFRMQWYNFAHIDRLERALKAARKHMTIGIPSTSARAH